MGEPLAILVFAILWWAWLNPHSLGQWIEKTKDPYRQKPIHQKKKKDDKAG